MPPGMLEEKYDEFTTHCFINHEYPADRIGKNNPIVRIKQKGSPVLWPELSKVSSIRAGQLSTPGKFISWSSQVRSFSGWHLYPSGNWAAAEMVPW